MKIKTFNIATPVIYLVVFNEFLYQNKFVMEKHIKFIIKTDTNKIYWIKTKKDTRLHIWKKLIKNQY
jgi:hypothetical protein